MQLSLCDDTFYTEMARKTPKGTNKIKLTYSIYWSGYHTEKRNQGNLWTKVILCLYSQYLLRLKFQIDNSKTQIQQQYEEGFALFPIF